MVVIKGGGVDENDLFKAIVDSGVTIPSVNSLIKDLEDYLTAIKNFKISNVIGISSVNDGFELIKLEKSKSKT